MNEAGFWSDRMRPLLVRECQAAKLRHHFERVENATGVGTPDVDWCIAGVAGKIELKFSPRHPVRSTTPLQDARKGLRRSQIVWAVKRLRAGGRVFLLVGTPESAWLIPLMGLDARAMTQLVHLTAPQACQAAAWCACHHSASTLPPALIGERPYGPKKAR